MSEYHYYEFAAYPASAQAWVLHNNCREHTEQRIHGAVGRIDDWDVRRSRRGGCGRPRRGPDSGR